MKKFSIDTFINFKVIRVQMSHCKKRGVQYPNETEILRDFCLYC